MIETLFIAAAAFGAGLIDSIVGGRAAAAGRGTRRSGDRPGAGDAPPTVTP
jgi:hypothetical protein